MVDRVYVRASFTSGGPFNEKAAPLGKYSKEYEVQRVDLERGSAVYAKRWCTPWFLGHYLSLRDGRFLRTMVRAPWILALLALVGFTVGVSAVIGAWGLLTCITLYFLVLPCSFWLISQWVASGAHSQRRRRRKALTDLTLAFVVVIAFSTAVISAGLYIGYGYCLIVTLAALVTFLIHLPAIRDQQVPPPRGHQQARAFYVKSICYRIIWTARQGAFSSYILILILVLLLKTVPQDQVDKSSITSHKAPPMPGYHSSGTPYTSSTSSFVRYPLCDLDFTGLSVLDFGAFSWAAYLDPPDEAQKYVDEQVNPQFKFVAQLLDIAGDSGLPYGPITYQFTDHTAKVRP